MEDLQEALEDAQYFNAVQRTQNPKQELPIPTQEELDSWKEEQLRCNPRFLEIEVVCRGSLGIYQFL